MSKCRTHFYRVGLPQKKNHILFRKLQNGLNRKQNGISSAEPQIMQEAKSGFFQTPGSLPDLLP